MRKPFIKQGNGFLRPECKISQSRPPDTPTTSTIRHQRLFFASDSKLAAYEAAPTRHNPRPRLITTAQENINIKRIVFIVVLKPAGFKAVAVAGRPYQYWQQADISPANSVDNRLQREAGKEADLKGSFEGITQESRLFIQNSNKGL